MVANIPRADAILHIVLIITLTSLMLQGTTLFNTAKWLKLAIPEGKARKPVLEFDSESIKSVIKEIVVESNFRCVNHAIVDLQLPKTSLIVMIERDDKYFTPNGNSIIELGDSLIILADTKENVAITYNALKEYHHN